MRPTPVSDTELSKGLEDASKYLPPRELKAEYWAEVVAEAVFYDTITEGAVWTPRLQFNHDDAMRHLQAIAGAKRLTPKDKLHYMAVLITLWWTGVAL